MEKRSLEKAIREINKDKGIVDAYLTAWNTIDSYNTSFQKGSFAKTFENRASKIRLLWNHSTLAGKVLEAREDDYGAFVQCQFNLETETGRTAFAHIKAGDVDAFSFGFNVINAKDVDGIRTFTEVKCLECSPVLFPANEAAVITDVRIKPEYTNSLQESFITNLTQEISEKIDKEAYEALKRGDLLPHDKREILAVLPECIQDAHQNYRMGVVKALTEEIGIDGFTRQEKSQIAALLGIKEKPQEIDETINFIKQFRQTLILNEVN